MAVATTLGVVGAMLGAPPAFGAPKHRTPPAIDPGQRTTGVHPLRATVAPARDDPARKAFKATATRWPAAASASLTLAATTALDTQTAPGQPAAVAGGAPSRAGRTPVWAQPIADPRGGYTGPGRLNVKVLDHAKATALGVSGVLMTIDAPASGGGQVRLGVDYRDFAQAIGGNFGARLRLVALPACALTTPTVPACRQAGPLASVNDPATQRVSTDLTFTGVPAGASAAAVGASTSMVLAATGDTGQDGGAGGSYAATTLTPSGTWSAGSNTGGFSYSYPIAVPPATTKLVPDISLSYSSTAADGKTSYTQPQASWVGDGWDTPHSFIEQTFTSCADEPEGVPAPKPIPDACYAGPILTLSLNGTSTALIPVGGDVWKAQDDSGMVIVRHPGSGNGTPTTAQDYWSVLTTDGTEYQFGRNRLPGWSGQAETKSVDYQPVYYPRDNGNPCYKSTFADSVCATAYRWNLDYVTDVHGTAMAYYYQQDLNHYAQYLGAKDGIYVRDSHLDHIDYGLRADNPYGTAANRVLFHTGDRCLTAPCSPLDASTKANWPDVPYDLICTDGTTCLVPSAAYFSTVRLASIDTQQYDPGGGTYRTVDSYALDHGMPTYGDAPVKTSPTLWLSSITRTASGSKGGGDTTPITLPPVSFTATKLPNRVDTSLATGLPAFYRFRIDTITTETGSVIQPTFTLVDPCGNVATKDPTSNTSSCYPVYWTPTGYDAPIRDWFNKYSVTRVTQTDPTGGAPAVQTDYRYLGGAAWHYDDNELVKAKYRTYGQFRGFATVAARTGNGVADRQTLVETTYYRGMSHDNGGAAVTVTDSAGGTHDDTDQLTGRVLETTNHLGDGGPVDNTTITAYWVSPALATRTRTGLPAVTATRVAPVLTYTRQAVTSSGSTQWRVTAADTSYDADSTSPTFGHATRTYTHTVPADPAYDQCTSTRYAPANTTLNLVGLPAEVQTVAVACGGYTPGAAGSVPGSVNTLTAPGTVRTDQVIGQTRSFYDDPSFATTFPQPNPPVRGDVTMAQQVDRWISIVPHFQTTTRTVVDGYGRPTAVTDANGNTTRTEYTDNAVGLTVASKAINALDQDVTATFDPQRGQTLTASDLNDVVTTQQFDALGRATGVWLHNRPTSKPADYVHSYTLARNVAPAATTKRLNEASGYYTSTVIYDGLLRQRQVQSPTPRAGRMVTDTFYDSRGWIAATYNGWWDDKTLPNTTPAVPGADIPNHDRFIYDGLGRPVVDTKLHNQDVVSTTITVYQGDRTLVFPPTGGVTTSTSTDPLGRTVRRDDYKTPPAVTTPADVFTGIWTVTGGGSVTTSFGYDARGNQATVTDAQDRTWTATYDPLGRVTAKTDPDAGTSSVAYDPVGNPVEARDARGKVVSTTYDALNRRTGQYNAPTNGQSDATRTAEWRYDNADNAVPGMKNPIGHLTTAVSYQNGITATTQAAGFNVFGNSLGETISIPTIPGAPQLAGTFTYTHTYMSTTGLPYGDTYPGGNGLPAETVRYIYTAGLNLPYAMGGDDIAYTAATSYDAWGRVAQQTLGSDPVPAYVTNIYDPHTGWLTNQTVTRSTDTTIGFTDRQEYRYDLVGKINRQTSTRLSATTPTETQCYSYDTLARLTGAWTATDDCAATPTDTNHATVGDSLGTTSAYWTTWTLDDLGNRTNQTQHAVTTSGSDTSTDYTYPTGTNPDGPDHALLSTTASTGASTAYGYDETGNTVTRTTPDHGQQTLTWTDSGQLATVTSPTTGTDSYVYDHDGSLLISQDATSTVLHLPSQELTLDATTSTVTGVRYYALLGGGTAIRPGTDASTVKFEVTDQHGSPTMYLDAKGQNPTWRQYTPYGEPRGASVTWPDTHAFLNATNNTSTGLTELGARNYDPTTGRFISVDPLFDAANAQQLNGYSYSSADPVNQSDPTGTQPLCGEYPGQCDAPKTPLPVPTGTSPPAQTETGCDATCQLGKPAPTPHHWTREQLLDFLAGHGYKVNGEFTVADALAFAQINTYNAFFACNDIFRLGLEFCKYGDPLMVPRLNKKQQAVQMFMILGAFLGPDILAEVLLTEGAALASLLGAGTRTAQALKSGRKFVEAAKGLTAKLSEADAKALLGILRCAPAKLSFSADTLVLMADGTTKPIKDINVDDQVLATDPTETGASNEPETVTALHLNHDTELADLTIANSSGQSSVVHTTSNHPFWDATTRRWTAAAALKPGDSLLTADGTFAHVVDVRAFRGASDMYNLTVTDVHTYYVVAGGSAVLVHNTAPCGPVAGNGANIANISASDAAMIQAAADRIGRPIHVVGSRAMGTAGPVSDWDYVVTGANSKMKDKIKWLAPSGARTGQGKGIDIFTGVLVDGEPYITFYPKGGR